MNEQPNENLSPRADEQRPAETQPPTVDTAHQPFQEAPSHPAPEAGSLTDPRTLRPKTGPIVWGVLVLAFCVYTAFQAVAPGSVNGTTFVIAVTITLGVLLLAIGAAVIVRSSKAPRR